MEILSRAAQRFDAWADRHPTAAIYVYLFGIVYPISLVLAIGFVKLCILVDHWRGY